MTGSHNPPDYNGLKMVIGGETLALDAIQQLKARIEASNLLTSSGEIRHADIREAYVAKNHQRREAGAADEDRHGLRQRRRRRHCQRCSGRSVAIWSNCSAKSMATSPTTTPTRRSRKTCRT